MEALCRKRNPARSQCRKPKLHIITMNKKDLIKGSTIADITDVMFVPALGLHMCHNEYCDYVLCLGSADRPDLCMWREAVPHEVRRYWDLITEHETA